MKNIVRLFYHAGSEQKRVAYIFSFHATGLYAFSHSVFVLVGLCGVKVPVTDLCGVFYGLRHILIADKPGSERQFRDLCLYFSSNITVVGSFGVVVMKQQEINRIQRLMITFWKKDLYYCFSYPYYR